jgi:anti-sigma regulatory factor (Ser/Thr protein kinase)
MMGGRMADPRGPAPTTRVLADGAAVRQVADALTTFCQAERLPDELVWKLRVVVDEVVANIVMHGGPFGGVPEIDACFRRTGDVVEVVIADNGVPFDPLAHHGPDLSLPLEAREPGGLGIVLVRALMDEVRYERTSRNTLTLRKSIGVAGSGADGD